MRDGDRRVSALPEERRVELHTDQEHVEDDADLGVHADEGHRAGRQKRRRQVGGHLAQEGRAKEYSADDFTHHGRLAQRPERGAGNPRRDDDEDEREDDLEERASRFVGECATDRGGAPGRRQVLADQPHDEEHKRRGADHRCVERDGLAACPAGERRVVELHGHASDHHTVRSGPGPSRGLGPAQVPR